MHKISWLTSRVSQVWWLTHIIIALRRIRYSKPAWLVWWVQVKWAMWEFVFKNHTWGINSKNVLLLPKACQESTCYLLFPLLISIILIFDEFNKARKIDIKLKKRKNETILLKINIIYVKYPKYLFKTFYN